MTSHQPFSLTLDVEGKCVRNYVVDAHHMIQETACKAAEYLREVSHSDLPLDEPEPSITADNVCNDLVGNAPHSDDQDSDLRTQSVLDEPIPPSAGARFPSWDAFREEFLPPSVKVTFNVDGLEPEKESDLRTLFPDINFERSPIDSAGLAQDVVDSNTQPRGVKSMVIELNDEEVAQDSTLKDKVQEQYPWATIQAKASPNTSKKRQPHSADQNVTDGLKLDPLRHFSDLAELAKEPPTSREFEIYNAQISENWDTLDFLRKIDIAHARAIQGQYGKVVDGGGCGPCMQAGYKCRKYDPELYNMSTIRLGKKLQSMTKRWTETGTDYKILSFRTLLSELSAEGQHLQSPSTPKE